MADNLIVEIERMKKSELSHVVDIARKEIYPGASKNAMSKWIKSLENFHGRNQYVQWYVARIKASNEIVGFVRWLAYDFDFENKRVILMQSWLAVKGEYQHKGVGTQLIQSSLEDVCKYWRKKGVKPVMVFVETDDTMNVARKFYEKVYENPDSVVIKDVWEPGEGTVFYFKKLG